jgi:hypothetical protein
MPSAVGSIRTLLVGGIVAVCSSMAIGDDGAPAPANKGTDTRPAAQRDGAVQQALRNLYIVPKASNNSPAEESTSTPRSAWREAGTSSAAGRSTYSTNETGDFAQTKPGSRWSPNLATQRRLRQSTTGQKASAGTPSDEDMRSAGLTETRQANQEQDRAYTPRSIGGYRGFGEYGYGRQGYSDYRRSMRWPGYSVEGYDAIRGQYRENGSYYGDNPVLGGAYGGYGGGFGGYGGGGYLPPSAGWTGDANYGYWEYQAEARTESLLRSGLTSRDRGLAAFREGRYREAADAFRLACETNQGDPAAQLYAGHALFAIGRYHDGAKYLRRALELQPKITFLTYDMRDDYRDRAEFERQFAALEEALRIAPRDEDRLFMMGYVLYYGGQRDRAYEAFARLLRVDPRDGVAARLMEACQPPDVVVGATTGNRP